MGRVVNATPRPLYPWGRDRVLILQGDEWVPGPVRNGYGKSRPTGGKKPGPSSSKRVATNYATPAASRQ